jgi:iron complex transport system substrate-binding protein
MLGLVATPVRAFAGNDRRSSVAAHFAVAQTMLAMGIVPRAIPMKGLYQEICVTPPLPREVIDIGLANEPNVELLLDINPEIIVIGNGQERLIPLFAQFSTVIQTAFARPAYRPYELAVQETRILGEKLEAKNQAPQLIDETQTAIQHCRHDLVGSRSVYIVTLMPDGRHATVWGQGSLVHDVLSMLGITNAWHRTVGGWGALTIGVEQLAENQEAGLIYIENADSGRALERLSRSPLWTSLPFVRKGRLSSVGSFYLYGGLPAAVRCAEGISSALHILEICNG